MDQFDRLALLAHGTVIEILVLSGKLFFSKLLLMVFCVKFSQLIRYRMMSSLSMGDFISPSGSCLSPLDESGLRVSHEHTDSGLGADQDYAYSSERYIKLEVIFFLCHSPTQCIQLQVQRQHEIRNE